MLLCSAVTAFFFLSEYADWLAEYDILMNILAVLLILFVISLLAFPIVLIVTLFIEGIKVIRHEGFKPANLLTMIFSVLQYLYLAVWPVIGGLEKGRIETKLYVLISFSAVYVLALMAVYLLSAALNLLHMKKCRGADYIIVLGAGVIGTRVTPLLAARIDKGIELLHYNPDAKLILSGGQGPGEDIAEGKAMAGYAKQQGLKCVGFGAKTKWYFTLNAFIREFFGYLSLEWRRHAVVAALIFIVSVFAA